MVTSVVGQEPNIAFENTVFFIFFPDFLLFLHIIYYCMFCWEFDDIR